MGAFYANPDLITPSPALSTLKLSNNITCLAFMTESFNENYFFPLLRLLCINSFNQGSDDTLNPTFSAKVRIEKCYIALRTSLTVR